MRDKFNKVLVARRIVGSSPVEREARDSDSRDKKYWDALFRAKEVLMQEKVPLTVRNYIEKSGLSWSVINRLRKSNITFARKLEIVKEKPGTTASKPAEKIPEE